MNVMRYSTILLIFSAVLVLAGIGSVALFGLELGIEFTGGSILEVEYINERPSSEHLREQLAQLELGSLSVQSLGEKRAVIRMKDIPEDVHQQVLVALGSDAQEMKFASIGPVIGKELRTKAYMITGLALLVIVLYVTFAFRKIVKPVRFWQWSAAALVALLHDVIVPLGVLALLGEFQGVQITVPVVVALLTVVGYSVNDTVVVFDRVRENLTKKIGVDFSDTVNKSLQQSFSRSINTSLTTLLVVGAIFFLGGETLRYFSLSMMIGIAAGTYSSLFVAPLLLVKWAGRRNS
jgi:preprotein translocase subunit SecF